MKSTENNTFLFQKEKNPNANTFIKEVTLTKEKRTNHHRQSEQEKYEKKTTSHRNGHRSKLNGSSVSNPATPKQRRETQLITTVIDLSTSADLERSHSAYSERSRWKHSTALSASANPWEIISYSSTQQQTPKQHRRTGYITEIYDKATNRFIPIRSY